MLRATLVGAALLTQPFIIAGQEQNQNLQGGAIVPGTLKIYGNDAYPVLHRKNQPIDSPRARYPGFKPSTTLLKKGTIRREGALALPCDITFERDVAVKLRDGITMYTDVFRPTNASSSSNSADKVPGIIAWGPYGKQIGGQWLDDVPGRAGVPLKGLSEFQKFEAPDPAYWVCHGYAILNPDSRGAYYSEGNITYWGRQLAEDGYDFVEWAAKEPWSNGKLSFSGNSYLAISQWFIAAEQPPHLAAIAPWEGFYDTYREASRRGGIAQPGFGEEIIQTYAGRYYIEDHVRTQLNDDLMSPYWEDKIARLDKITVPAYIVASYVSPIHTHGSFEGFRQIASKDKWLRVHNTGEWPDYYEAPYVDDLRKFYDRYLKGIDNGWEKTPKVRLSVLNPGGKDIVNRPEENWPVPGTVSKSLYFQSNKWLIESPSTTETKFIYPVSQAGGGIILDYKIPQDVEMIGYPKVKLWVEADGSNDMELTVSVLKRDANRKAYAASGPFPIAASGLLRVSHRELDPNKTTVQEPYHLHKREQLLNPGEIVPVEIGCWPLSLKFKAGDTLTLAINATTIPPVAERGMFANAVIPLPADGGTFFPGEKVPLVNIGGAESTKPVFVKLQGVKSPLTRNKGNHIIHFGGKYDSHVLVPFRA